MSNTGQTGPAAASQRKGRIAIVVLVAAMLLVSATAIYTNLTSKFTEAVAKSPDGLETLTIVTASGPHPFQVEVMRTDEERGRGLMERRFMPADRGMLFDFHREEPVAMWMKNTYIPLDMVFIRKDGTVQRIAERTEPLSERTIESGAPVLGVLELNGGAASQIGLKPGDKVQHPLFGK